MNSVLALLCVSLLVEGNLAVLPGKIANHEAAQLWKQWKHINGKDYQTYAEELNRFEIWIDNLKAVSGTKSKSCWEKMFGTNSSKPSPDLSLVIFQYWIIKIALWFLLWPEFDHGTL